MAEIKNLEFVEGTTVTAPADAKVTAADPDGSNAQHLVTVNYLGTLGSSSKNNVSASDPLVTNDSDDGYSVGSRWLNSTTGVVFYATDVTVGAAVWKEQVSNDSTQTISGAKTFSSAVNISDTTESTDKDTGSVIIDGGVGIEKNLNVGGNATITGDLTVNGTTTTINTETLDVTDANITVNKNGNQATADTNDAGITVEMSDATDVKIGYDSTLQSKFFAGDGTTPADQEIITSKDTQTLGNKTLETPIIDNAAIFNEETTPSNPSAGSLKLYPKSDGNFYKLNSAGEEVQIGGSGSGAGRINYVLNSDAEVNLDNVSIYNDSTTDTPADGDGGTPSGNLTLSRITSNTVRGAGSFRLAVSGNCQGEGVAIACDTIDRNDYSSLLNFQIDYSYDGADGDYGLWIYDITNSSLINCVPFELPAGNHMTFTTVFQNNADTASLRGIIHRRVATATATNFDFDNIIIGPVQDVAIEGSVQEIYSFNVTTSLNNSTLQSPFQTISNTYKSTHGAVDGNGVFTSPKTASYILAAKYSMDSYTLSTTQRHLIQLLIDGSEFDNYWIYGNGSSNEHMIEWTVPVFLEKGQTAQFKSLTGNGTQTVGGSIPLLSITEVANGAPNADDGGRVVSFDVDHSAAAISLANDAYTDMVLTNVKKDTHGGYNISTGEYTIQESGDYWFYGLVGTGVANWTSSEQIITKIYQSTSKELLSRRYANATFTGRMDGIIGGMLYDLKKGDVVKFQVYQNSGAALDTQNDVDFQRWGGFKIQGPSAPLAGEKVYASYTTNAGQTINHNTTTIIDFEDKIVDSHSAVSIGASFKFTAPKSDSYFFMAKINYNSGTFTQDVNRLRLYVDGVEETRWQIIVGADGLAAEHGVLIVGIVHLDKSQYMDIRALQTTGGSISLNADTGFNRIDIFSLR
jgi:predicted secreted protein